ncbi:hypothetical protein Trydic_g19056 [Trypoxylus dichotomus]
MTKVSLRYRYQHFGFSSFHATALSSNACTKMFANIGDKVDPMYNLSSKVKYVEDEIYGVTVFVNILRALADDVSFFYMDIGEQCFDMEAQ